MIQDKIPVCLPLLTAGDIVFEAAVFTVILIFKNNLQFTTSYYAFDGLLQFGPSL